MSTHIAAGNGDIAEAILLPGDPLRAKFGCLALEMECAELYTLAAKYDREALGILTISDSLITKETTTAEERRTTFTRMMEAALETAVS